MCLKTIGAVFSGAIGTLSFAPYSFWPAMLISLIALFVLILHSPRPKFAAFLGLSWGLGYFGTGISWIYVVIDKFGGLPTPIGLLLISFLIIYLASYPALFAYILKRANLTRAQALLLFAPPLWVVIDGIRGWFLTGFPWLWPGYSQIDGPLASVAPLVGVQGISFLLVFIAGAISLALIQKNGRPLFVVGLLFVLCGVLSQFHWVTQNKDKVKIAMIQGNIPQEIKWLPSQRWPTLLLYQDMTRKNWDADIIIWPEAAIPALERDLPHFLDRLDKAAKNNNSTIITGLLDKKDDNSFYNTLITIGKNGEGDYQYPAKESYSKHHLLVFGEFVPFGDLLRPLAPLFNLPMSSFSRGEYTQENVNANGYQLASAICYEIAFHEQVRKSLTVNSDFILTLSNDTWFGDSIGPHQHLEIARMRALENAKPLLRSTNTGLTAVIDYKGKIVAQIPQFETQVLRATINTTQGQTPYTRWGDGPLYLWMCFSLCVIIWQRRKNINLSFLKKIKINNKRIKK